VRGVSPAKRERVVRRTWDRRAFARLAWLLIGSSILVAGFVHAAAQHFAAVRLGYEAESLRRERARLLEERRQLLIALERADSPQAIERAARAQGLEPARAWQVNRAITHTAPALGATSTFGP
jgi:hypothetical protein